MHLWLGYDLLYSVLDKPKLFFLLNFKFERCNENQEMYEPYIPLLKNATNFCFGCNSDVDDPGNICRRFDSQRQFRGFYYKQQLVSLSRQSVN